MSDVITLSRLSIPPPVAFPKAPFLVLCFLSCIHYPLSTLISFLSLNHQLYADDTDTQLFFFLILPAQLDSSITHLLTLNSSKTEFLLTGLKKQFDN